jgi:hypothetical protein
VYYGFNCKTYRCQIDDGARHSIYAYPGWYGEDVYFYRGKNDLEAPGTANLLVVNYPTVAGTSYRTLRCTFDAGGMPNISATQQHGADANELFDSVTHDDPIFIGQIQCIDVAAKKHVVNNPTVISCGLFALNNRINGNLLVQGVKAGATVDRIIQFDQPGRYVGRNNAWNIRYLDVGAYRSNTATVIASVESYGERINVTSGSSSTNAQLFRIAAGSIVYKDLELGPALANEIAYVVYAGFSGGSAKVKASQNYMPIGQRWYINGTTYNGLAAWQAAGYDAGTIEADYTASAASDFNVANGNLETVTGWTMASGTAGTATVVSNQAAITGTAQTFYRRLAASKADHWVAADIASVPVSAGPFPLVVRGADSNNWVGCRWSTTAINVFRCIAGAAVQAATIAAAPAVNYRLLFAVRGDKAWVYLNGIAIINGAALAATAIGANTGCGLVVRTSVLNPALDNFEAGILVE